jgi:hypothetical protein
MVINGGEQILCLLHDRDILQQKQRGPKIRTLVLKCFILMWSLSSIWVNYHISLTWIKAIWGWFLLFIMIPSEVAVRSL